MTEQKGISADLLKLVKGAATTLSGNLSGKILLFLLTVYIARRLGATEVGIYFLALTITHVLAIIALAGLDVGIVRYVAIYAGRNDLAQIKGTVVAAIALAGAVSCLITCLALITGEYVVQYFFAKPALTQILKLLAIAIPFETLMKVMLAVTRGFKQMKYVAITQNLIWIGLRLVLTVWFIEGLGAGLIGIAWAYLVSSVVAAIAAACFMARFVPLFDRQVRCIYNIKALLRFSIPMVFTVLIYDVMSHIDVLMLGVFMPAADIGIYTVAVRVLSFAQVIFVVFQPIFQPFVAELHDKQQFDHLSGLLKNITHWSVSISLPFFLSLLVFPGFFLSIFGQAFVAGSACMIVLTIAFFFNAISNLPASMLFMAGRSDLALKNNVLILTVNTSLNYLFIPAHGLIGAAYATGISFLVLATLRIIQVHRLMSIHPFRPSLLKPLAAGLISFSWVVFQRSAWVHELSTAQCILELIVCFSIYPVLVFVFRLGPEDRIMLNQIGRKLSPNKNSMNKAN